MYDTDEYNQLEQVNKLRRQLQTWGVTEEVLRNVLDLLESIIREMPKQRDHGQD